MGTAAAWHLGPEASLLTPRRTCLRMRCRQHGRPCVQAPQAPGYAADDMLAEQPQDTVNDQAAAWLSEARLRAHLTQPDLAVPVIALQCAAASHASSPCFGGCACCGALAAP